MLFFDKAFSIAFLHKFDSGPYKELYGSLYLFQERVIANGLHLDTLQSGTGALLSRGGIAQRCSFCATHGNIVLVADLDQLLRKWQSRPMTTTVMF